jgi:glycerol kinase
VPDPQTPAHAPFTHSWPAAHALPQLPQFAGSTFVSTQADPHIELPAPHGLTVDEQLPAAHVAPAPHAFPQAPQFALSLVVSTHDCPHWVLDAPQAETQAPALQKRPAMQTFPQAPQLAGSTCTLAHDVPHIFWLAVHVRPVPPSPRTMVPALEPVPHAVKKASVRLHASVTAVSASCHGRRGEGECMAQELARNHPPRNFAATLDRRHASGASSLPMSEHLLAIDQGTTGTTAIVLSLEGETLGRHTFEFKQHFPKPGWVEHDVEEIWRSVAEAVTFALNDAEVGADSLVGIGITNQRETTVVWERATGKAIANAIVWQCRRTAETCAELKAAGHEPRVRAKTGLLLDAYFSGTKIAWLLDHTPGARARAEKGELSFGTIDSFLVHRLTGGDQHVTDVTNASRTLLLDLATSAWDAEMLELFRVPASVLPRVVGNAERVGVTRGVSFLPDGIPITGMAGDQQAALFGQACFDVGDAKCTYGTGAFALMNTGKIPVPSKHGLITTIAFRIGGETTYALEGSSFIAGAAVQWLRDGLGLIKTAHDVEALARKVASTDSVVFVPALSGLGAPHWDQDARGAIVGITRGTTAAHIARATLEGIAFSVGDLLQAMQKDAGHPLSRLRVDGGAAANDLLMQLQADLAGCEIDRPAELESTGRGAAMLAGIGAGVSTPETAKKMLRVGRRFAPTVTPKEREARLAQWEEAIRRVMSHP